MYGWVIPAGTSHRRIEPVPDRCAWELDVQVDVAVRKSCRISAQRRDGDLSPLLFGPLPSCGQLAGKVYGA